MYFTEILILSKNGDLFLSEIYKNVCSVKEEMIGRVTKDNINSFDPCFISKKGLNCHYIQRADVYICSASIGLGSVFVFDVLERFSSILKDFCGGLDNDTIENNVILVYDVLNQFMDNGIVQIDTAEQMKALILMQHSDAHPTTNTNTFLPDFPVSEDILNILGLDRPANTLPSKASDRSILGNRGGQSDVSTKSELFVDVIERLNVVVEKEGSISCYEIDGKVALANHLLGNPSIKMRFNRNQPGIFNRLHHNFHALVEVEFLKNVLSFEAEEGQSTLLSYKTNKEVEGFMKKNININDVNEDDKNKNNNNNLTNNTCKDNKKDDNDMSYKNITNKKDDNKDDNKNDTINDDTNDTINDDTNDTINDDTNDTINDDTNIDTNSSVPILVDYSAFKRPGSDRDITLRIRVRPRIDEGAKINHLSVVFAVVGSVSRIITKLQNFKNLKEECEVINTDYNNSNKNNNNNNNNYSTNSLKNVNNNNDYKVVWKLQDIVSNDDIVAFFELLDVTSPTCPLASPLLQSSPSSSSPQSSSSQLSLLKFSSFLKIGPLVLNYEVSNHSLTRLNISAVKFYDNTSNTSSASGSDTSNTVRSGQKGVKGLKAYNNSSKDNNISKSWIRYIVVAGSHVVK